MDQFSKTSFFSVLLGLFELRLVPRSSILVNKANSCVENTKLPNLQELLTFSPSVSPPSPQQRGKDENGKARSSPEEMRKNNCLKVTSD